jgi:hypothetical protein
MCPFEPQCIKSIPQNGVSGKVPCEPIVTAKPTFKKLALVFNS